MLISKTKARMVWPVAAAGVLLVLVVAGVIQAASLRHVPASEILDWDGPDGLVVVGEVIEVAADELSNPEDKRVPLWLATIAIKEILRGRVLADQQNEKIDRVVVAWPNLGKAGIPRVTYKVGDAGVWILERESGDSNIYRANHPGRLVPMKDKGEVERILSRQAVRITLDLQQFNDNPRRIRLHIWNTWKGELRLAHPSDRRALSFFVTDHLGNAVAPVGRAKVDPPAREIVIKAGERYTHELGELEFLTGSALFGFDLKPNSDYRVIAVYRPEKDGAGVASAEKSFRTR